jgi:hypothetical protein
VRNPWLELPASPPYVLDADRLHVEAFNALVASGKPQWNLDPRLYPEPFFGNRTANLLILARNPGIDDGDYAAHRHTKFLAAMRANLLDDPAGHVVTALREEFARTPAGLWWRPKLRQLIAHCASAEELAKRILVVEFHGYHSRNWHSIGMTLPSQEFGFNLVANAVERGATIICTRGWVDWGIAVPALRKHPLAYRLSSHRNATVSERNLGPDAFRSVLAALG